MILLLAFPVWALSISVVALMFPQWFVDLKVWIVPLLMAVMLGMGLTLRWQDFISVWQHRTVVALGVAIQFLVMPLAAWILSLVFGLSLELTIGMMLVGATAGGTASNVMAYLAKGDVALSVSMTIVSTLAAVVLLPVLTWLYLGQQVDVAVSAMLMMLFKIIIVPIVIGMALKTLFDDKIQKIQSIFPLFSMLVILFIIAIVVALNSNNLSTVAWTVVFAVILHNLIGLMTGYFLAKKLGYDSVIARTVAIEVGMQNSGLSVALALKYFSVASALPGAMFSIWHNLSGALFASYWQNRDKSR
ncbi:bile acid:sodium symporter [Thiomicrorhabdus immobilis]|uniref:Bile acid:sodium symporter n=1 Tax=Thiomicrorhabdus immobilis TaxID=2791037 RepID=A0ABN6CVX0_9GAMM|nr:bile acid:sodium symporter family protein [Thiomicrorhabdus immobilis]BCN93163.1 bile acid:sodium symporter [Thiomicrorhabdus immobilis]